MYTLLVHVHVACILRSLVDAFTRCKERSVEEMCTIMSQQVKQRVHAHDLEDLNCTNQSPRKEFKVYYETAILDYIT